MKKIHEALEKQSNAYAKWHKHPNRSQHHVAVLVVLIALVFSSVASGISNITQSEAAANQLQTQKGKTKDNQVVSLTNKLLKAVGKYQRAESKDKAGALSELVTVISERKAVLKSLAVANPTAVFFELLPPDAIDQFPQEIRALLEQRVQTTGVLTVYHIDSDNSHFEYELEEKNTGKRYKMHFSEGRPEDTTGAILSVDGMALDEDLFLAYGGKNSGSTQTVAPAVQASLVSGEHRALLIAFNFMDNTSEPWTTQQIAEALFTNPDSTNSFYQESSYQNVTFGGDIAGWFTIPYLDQGCAANDWRIAAENAATQAGYVLSNYSKHVYFFPGGAGCAWNGSSTVGGNPSRSWVRSQTTQAWNSQLLSHELGHALGMQHASAITCGSKAIDVYGNCQFYGSRAYEYVVNHDVMGEWQTGHWHNNAPHKEDMGWLSTSTIRTVTTGGIYRIAPIEIATTTYQALKIAKPDTTQHYYVEYRQPLGFDSSFPSEVTAGSGINISDYNPTYLFIGSDNTRLIDNTPGDNNHTNHALTDGNSFQDPMNGINITQLSHDSNGAVVQVEFTTPVCVKGNPLVHVLPTVNSGYPGTAKTYSIRVVNTNSLACASVTYDLTKILPSGFSSTFTPSSVTVSSNSYGTAQMTVQSPAGIAEGNYDFDVYATNRAEPQYSDSKWGRFTVIPDTTAPVISSVANSQVGNGKTSRKINWNTNEASDTQVEYGTTTSMGTLSPLNSTMVTSHSVTLNGLTSKTNYYFVVKSKDASGNLAVSAQGSFTTK
jgi:hypothetical protein